MHFGTDIGIDLGTANVCVYIKKQGIVLNEPCVVAIETNTGKLKAVGKKAKDMLGRVPADIKVIRPLRNGVISDYNVTLKMLRFFINETCGKRRFFRPRIMVCVPSGVTEVERKAVVDAATEAGGAKVFLIEEPMAAAIGAGVDIFAAEGHMIVDIGGGTSDIAVMSLGGIVARNSIKVAGDAFDDAIQRYIKKEYSVLIGDVTAEQTKQDVGSVIHGKRNLSVEIRGRHAVSGLPKTLKITSEELVDVLMEPAELIIEAIHQVLEKTPPEIAADMAYNGIVLTGGGALLDGMDLLISKHAQIPCYVAENALESVALGTGLSLEKLDYLQKVLQK